MSLSINKPATNEVKIEGIVSEIKLREASTTKNGKNMEYIAGEVVLEVEQEINGETEISTIPLSVFASKLKKDGGSNPAYSGLEEIKNTYNSIASAGRENADRVRVMKGEIVENSFFNDSNELITSARVRNSFFKRLTNEEFNPHANFIVKIVILNIKEETDREGIETGRLAVKGGIVQWGGKVDVVDFVVESKDAIEYIKQNYNKNETVQVSGRVRFSVTTITNEIEQAFGEPIIDTKTRTKREFLITSGSQGGMDEDESYSVEEIAKALEQRKLALEESNKKTKEKSSAGTVDTGF